MRTRTRVAGAAMLVLLPVAAACGSGSASPEPPAGPVPAVRGGADLVLPLDAYDLDPGERGAVTRAAWRLVRDCVARFGGGYSVPEPSGIPLGPRFEHRHERRYGLLDPRVRHR